MPSTAPNHQRSTLSQCRALARCDAVLAEANAIGTTALRARLLPAPHNVDVSKMLQEYVRIRLDIIQRVPSSTELNADATNRARP
jgi:hypothetical protein